MTSKLKTASRNTCPVSAVLVDEPYSKLDLPRICALGKTRDLSNVVSNRRRVGIYRQVRIRRSIPVLNI